MTKQEFMKMAMENESEYRVVPAKKDGWSVGFEKLKGTNVTFKYNLLG